jgi:signal transduction histidine kinase
VRKHVQAGRAIVLLDYRPAEVGLRIQDDGVGSTLEIAHLDTLQSNFGLFGLRERVQLAGGSLRIQTAPQQGFYLEINLPVG